MRYLLSGYYGMRNVGDDALLYVALAEVAHLDPAARFTVLSSLEEALPPGAHVTVVPGGRRFENLRQMLNHDVWLFGGGGLLQDMSPRAVAYLERLGKTARLVKWLGRRIALVGIGVGPLGTPAGRRAAQRLLTLADFVTVRDAESLALARELAPEAPIRLTGDLALLLSRNLPDPEPRRPAPARTLGVSLLPYARSLGGDEREDEANALAMAAALKRVLARHRDWRVVLFEFFSGSRSYGDDRVLRVVEARLALGERVVYRPYTGDLAAVCSDLAACDAFVGMRFHACVLAHAAGIPCLMLAYHPKSESLAARLALDTDAVAPLSALGDPVELEARLEALLTDRARFQPAARLDGLIRASERNFSLFSGWLHPTAA